MSLTGTPVDAVIAEAGLSQSLDDIGAYIVRQRWSGGQGRRIRDVNIVDTAVLAEGDATLLFTVTRVAYADGTVREYALPLGLRRIGDPLAERAPDFMIAPGLTDDSRFLYDALGDPEYVQWLWTAVRGRRTLQTARSTLRFECPDPDALEPDPEPPMRILGVEQSNTSLILGDSTFVKHVRRVEPGPSHELEMLSALTAAGFRNLAPVQATAMYGAAGAAGAPIVLVQRYLHNGTEGWSLALTSLRDLYADAEEAADAGAVERISTVDEHGGAFTGESGRLGAVSAAMHLALTQPGLGADVEPVPLTGRHLHAWADSMTRELDQLLTHPESALDPLRDARDAVIAHFEALRSVDPAGLCTRIHGDLHLGQTLRTDSGWIILDFEGEPDRTPAERRERSSPLRDVAGMLRSLDYAAAVALAERVLPESADWNGMLAYGDAWAQANRDSFWSGYLSAVGDRALLPSPGATTVVRRAFEVQKAVYEVGYELTHRPSWIDIPMRFLLRGAA